MDAQDEAAGGRVERAIARARAGDREAIDALCARLRPGLEDFIGKRLDSRARRWTSPEDIAQGVLVEMVRQLTTLEPDASMDDLVRRVRRTAGFRIRDSLRSHRLDRGESTGPMEAADPAANAPSAGPVTSADYRRWLEELVGHLPPAYGEVVRLCAFEELTFVEAAARLGLKPDTVRKRYDAARKALDQRRRTRAGE